jgi:hypothetical protein
MEIEKHLLQRRWKMFIHYPMYSSSYGNAAYRDVLDFDTVEDFWEAHEYMPVPSHVFANASRPRLKLNGKNVEAFGIFDCSVQPEWEKSPGGHWEFGGIRDTEALDSIWETLCLTLVGETVSQGLEVVGIRVVDKSKCKSPLYRVEVWVSSQEDAVKNDVFTRVTAAIEEATSTTGTVQSCWKDH